MSIKKLVAAAAMTSLSGVLLLLAGQSTADTLVVDNELFCDSISNVSWTNGRLTVACDGVTNPPTPNPPTPNPPTPNPPTPNPPVNSSECGVPETNLKTETYTGKGFEREISLAKGGALVVPFLSGPDGDIKKIAFGEPVRSNRFKKTVIISKCKGVYNPEDYDYRTSVDVCAITGYEMSFTVISGQSRVGIPIAKYRCVFEPNQQYYINVFQYDSGNRPPYTEDTSNTCRSSQCGLRVLIR